MKNGFTLIELMIVVAIIGILAAFAVPAYQDYLIKTKWKSNVAELEDLKQTIRTCMQLKAEVGSLCDNLIDLRESGYSGTVFPTPRYAVSQPTISGVYKKVTVTFQGTPEVKSLVYSADGIVDASGNMVFIRNSNDTLGFYYEGDRR